MPSVMVWLMAPRRSVSVRFDGSKPGNSTCTFTVPDGERRHGGQAALVRHDGDRLARRGRDDDRGRGNAGAGLIDDDEAQLRLVGVLRRRTGAAAEQARERRRGVVSFGERVRLEVRIDLVALDLPFLVGLAVDAARDEVRQLDAVHRLVVGQVGFDRDRLGRAAPPRRGPRRSASACRPVARPRREPTATPAASRRGQNRPWCVIISGMCVA